MEQNKANTSWTAEDIQRYLGGTMPPAEMNALEKAALDDPFLAEALEGYQQLPAALWEAPLLELRKSFAAGAAPAKVVGMPATGKSWFKYAAAAVLIIAAAGTYLLLNRNNSQQGSTETAAAEKKEQAPAAVTVPALPATDSASIAAAPADKGAATTEPVKKMLDALKKDTQLTAIATPEAPESLLSPQGITDYKKEAEKIGENRAVLSPAPAAGTQPATTLPANTAAAERADELKDVVVTSAAAKRENRIDNFYNQQGIISNSQNLARARAANQQEVNRMFNAQVVDAANNPLPFANISVKNENFGTYADVKGNVRLVSTDSIIPIEVRSAGFKPQTIVLRSNLPQNRVVLQPDESAGYREYTSAQRKSKQGSMSRRAMLQRDSSLNAEPADGWDNYDTYFTNNLEVPNEVLNKNIHGAVELSFDVKSNGTITNIKVDRSLCSDCDELAKRLLEQGPQWKVKKGKKARGKVVVQF